MALKDDADNWVFEDDALRNLVSNFYSSLFTTFGIINVDFPTGCSFPTIFSQDLEFLDRDVSIEETKQALFSMQNLKSPGPTGFIRYSSSLNGRCSGPLSMTLLGVVLQILVIFRELIIPF